MKDFSKETENRGKYMFLNCLLSFASQAEFVTISHLIKVGVRHLENIYAGQAANIVTSIALQGGFRVIRIVKNKA